jgi:cell division septum initiation protein DivIVA
MELRDLRTGFRGYQKEDVTRLVGERDQRCASLQQELERLRARLTEQEQTSEPESGEAIAAALISAQEFAARTRGEAEREAEQLRTQGKEESERLIAEARAEADRLRVESRAQADSWLSEARAEAERLLTEAREEAARLRRETEDELLRQKQEAVQMLAAADRQAAEEAERIAQARACAEEVRRRTREALMQLDSLMSGMLASRSVPDSFAEESSGSEVEEEPAEDGADW